MFLTLITFLIILSVLVFAHELGHFFVARKFGVKAEEFGIGFSPRLGGVYRDTNGKWKFVRGNKQVKDASDTIYSVNWIPLGGFVKLGEDDVADDNPDHFNNKPVWQRASILSAGVAMNVVTAAILIIIGMTIGLPQTLEGVSKEASVSERKIQIIQIEKDSPAERAGLEIGDELLEVGGQALVDYDMLQSVTDRNTDKEISYSIVRGEEKKEFKIIPVLMEKTGKGGIGIGVAETGIVKYPWYLAIWEGTKTTLFLAWAIIVAFYELFKGMIMGNGVSADVAGPVGIAVMTGRVVDMGFIYILQFTALLSVNLAIINFLPIPALDGGRVVFLIIEKIKKSPVKKELEAAIHYISFMLLMFLVLFVTIMDVMKFRDKFERIWEKIIG